jgi:hypothetical protein
LIQSLQSEIGVQQPNIDLLYALCRERAEKFNATVEFVRVPGPDSKRNAVFTEKSPASGAQLATYELEIKERSHDDKCPSCGSEIGVGGLTGSRPHNVIPAAMWGSIIDNVFKARGVTLPAADSYYGEIRGAGTQTRGPATTQDKQCRDCEEKQDKTTTESPCSLVQRANGKSRPPGVSAGDYVGNQFQNTTPDQMTELTNVKIDDVVRRIRYMLELPPKLPSRPPGHDIYTKIVNPGLTDAVLNELTTEAQKQAL